MPRISTEKQFARVMDRLVTERTNCVAQRDAAAARVEEIDAMFRQYGLAPAAEPAPVKKGVRGAGRGAAKRAKAGGRTRGVFAISGEQSVLAFVKAQGNPTTAQINKHWAGEGRGGKANNTLTRLVQDKQLKRADNEGGRGSRYTLA